MSSSTFKAHFNMISMNEPVQRKAKFWTSYVRALKGTEDMRANDDNSAASRRRQQSAEYFPRSTFDEMPQKYSSEEPSLRIHAPGYKYQPVSRDTYGYSPRTPTSTYTSPTFRHHTRK